MPNDLLSGVVDFVPDVIPSDEAPETSHELSCEVCGKELHYAGRGRKPKRCDEHKKGGGTTRRSRSENIGKNEQLAAQAAEALVQVNTLAEMGARFGKMEYTAEALSTAKEAFREQVFEALKTDPELCKLILRGGVQSARIQLLIAYGMLASVVVPVAAMEIKAKREAAKEANGEDRPANAGTTSAA